VPNKAEPLNRQPKSVEFPLFSVHKYQVPYIDPIEEKVWKTTTAALHQDQEESELRRLDTIEGRRYFAMQRAELMRYIPRDHARRWRLLQQVGLVMPGRPLPAWAAEEDAARAKTKE
jgi:hypothetical protein